MSASVPGPRGPGGRVDGRRGAGEPPRPAGPRGPRLGVTSLRRLASIAFAGAVVAWGFIDAIDVHSVDALSGQAFAVPWTLPIAIAVLAVGVTVSARNWRRRLAGDERAKPVPPLAGARALGLAKACSHTGALLTGGFAGYALVLLERLDSELRRGRFVTSAAAVLASVVLVAAGVILERSLRLPEDDEPRPIA